jgi:hypothetical protein
MCGDPLCPGPVRRPLRALALGLMLLACCAGSLRAQQTPIIAECTKHYSIDVEGGQRARVLARNGRQRTAWKGYADVLRCEPSLAQHIIPHARG